MLFSAQEYKPKGHLGSIMRVGSGMITLRYPASAGYCSYKYRSSERKLEVEFTGSAEHFEMEILLPSGRHAQTARLNGREAEITLRTIEQSTYLVLAPIQHGVHRVEVDLA